MYKPAEQDDAGSGAEDGFGALDRGLEVLCRTPVAVDPGEELQRDNLDEHPAGYAGENLAGNRA